MDLKVRISKKYRLHLLLRFHPLWIVRRWFKTCKLCRDFYCFTHRESCPFSKFMDKEKSSAGCHIWVWHILGLRESEILLLLTNTEPVICYGNGKQQLKTLRKRAKNLIEWE